MDRLQATTAVTKHNKKAIMGRLDKIMDTINKKMKKAMVYKSRIKDQA